MGSGAHRSHSSFTDDKVPVDLITQSRLYIYLRTKSHAQHDSIDHCILSRANDIQRKIKVKGQKLGTVTSFKYFGAVVSHNGSKPDVSSRIAEATTALTKRKPIWRDSNISLRSKTPLSLPYLSVPVNQGQFQQS